MLIEGVGTENLAKAEGVSARYTLRLVRLAFLSPDTINLIVEGRQPQWLRERD